MRFFTYHTFLHFLPFFFPFLSSKLTKRFWWSRTFCSSCAVNFVSSSALFASVLKYIGLASSPYETNDGLIGAFFVIFLIASMSTPSNHGCSNISSAPFRAPIRLYVSLSSNLVSSSWTSSEYYGVALNLLLGNLSY